MTVLIEAQRSVSDCNCDSWSPCLNSRLSWFYSTKNTNDEFLGGLFLPLAVSNKCEVHKQKPEGLTAMNKQGPSLYMNLTRTSPKG